MSAAAPVAIVGAARTPIGAFLGELKDVSAPQLGAHAIEAAVTRAGLAPNDIDEVVMGCVLSAGLGQAPARQAALGAGLPETTGAVTINKMCGSGMKAVMLASDQLAVGGARVAVAGGMESMSNAPYLLDRARTGYRMGHRKVLDHMFLDGLEDAYEKGRLMGSFAEDCATEYQFTREMQDQYASTSLARAQGATADDSFAQEIAPITLGKGANARVIASDELPGRAKAQDIARLKPAFGEDGTITAANASAISDGAAALALMRVDEAERAGATPLAIIRDYVTVAGAPSRVSVMPIEAIRKLMDRVGWAASEVDLFEINEAFAVVARAAMRELDLPHEKVNVRG
ncbi:MAG: acetyl-CoA C-acyltransferase, partial [Methylocystis silviterrae]